MSIPLPSAEKARELYLVWHGNSLDVFVPDCQNVLTLVTSPNLFRTAYLSADAVNDQNQIQNAAHRLDNEWPLLMMFSESTDGAPFRSAIVFFRQGSQPVPWWAGSLTGAGLVAEVYLASTSVGNAGWSNDVSGGKPGYFLTGLPQLSDLWHIKRMEPDAAKRLVFTLAPIRLAHGLPEVRFTPIADPHLRAEAERHYSEFMNHLMQHQYYALVTSAKNVAETLLADYLTTEGISWHRDFNEMLQKLAELVEGAKSQSRARFSYLDYHLMHKIRLLHARTHSPRAASTGRSITPEFSLTVAEDLVEILTSAGCAGPTL